MPTVCKHCSIISKSCWVPSISLSALDSLCPIPSSLFPQPQPQFSPSLIFHPLDPHPSHLPSFPASREGFLCPQLTHPSPAPQCPWIWSLPLCLVLEESFIL